MPRQYRVGVVGFGVAGATASLLLARAGHEVSLFERAPQVGPVGAGILLQPSGQAILDRLGLFNEVTARGEPIAVLHALTQRGKTLIRLPYGEIEPGCRAYGLHRGDLFDVLHQEVVAARVRIILGCEIQVRRAAGRQVYVVDSAGMEHGPFDFVLAADGGRSRLRISARLTRWTHEYDYGAVWAIGRNPALHNKLHQVVRGTRRLVGLLPMGRDRCSLFFGLRRDEKDAVWRRGFTAWKNEVVELCPEAAPLFDELTDFKQVAFTTYQHVWMRQWHDDHTLFLGDAAHAMSPHLGQGINLALQDAFCFAEALARSRNPREAFRAYSRARQEHLRYYAFVTLLLTPFFQSNGIIKGWVRDLALPIMTALPWVRRQMLLTMGGLKRGFFGGRLNL